MDYNISDLLQLATRAHNWTSFDPEKRGATIISDYNRLLADDLKSIPESEHQRYYDNFRNKLTAWLHAKSNCISTMITGPANFPIARAERANRIEEKRYAEFKEWRERALNAIEKKVLAARSPEEISNQKWESLRGHILSSAKTITEIDGGINTYSSRQLFVSSITGLVKRVANSGDVVNTNRMLELIKELNEKSEKPIITAKNSIWKLGEVAEANRELKAHNSVRESQYLKLPKGTIRFNYQADRLQILFEGKPPQEIIKELKSCAFKWAPSQNAWQRKLTNNAIFTTKHYLMKHLQ